MSTGQRESRLGVIEGGVWPTRRLVTLLALLPQQTLVRIVLTVAGGAGRSGALEFHRLVALSASRPNVSARQRKSGPGVVEGDVLPTRRVVAPLTLLPQQALVRIILLMAGYAGYRRTLEFSYVLWH